MKQIGIIGANSFVANYFIKKYENNYKFICFERERYFTLTENDFNNCDVVINFAAIVHRPDIQDEAVYDKINYELPVFLAKLALKSDVSHFIQISTIAVYGNNSDIDINSPELPINPYGRSKLKADNVIKAMSTSHFVTTSLRPSMIYGGGKAPGNLQSLIKLGKLGIPVPFKNLNNKRQFMNINNFINILDYCISSRPQGVLILADSEGISTANLMKYIYKALGKSDRCFTLPLFWKIIQILIPSIYQKLANQLKITPSLTCESIGKFPQNVETGIQEMMHSTQRVSS